MSLKDNVTVVEDSIQELQKSLREYKMLLEVSRADIVSMENKFLCQLMELKSRSPPR